MQKLCGKHYLFIPLGFFFSKVLISKEDTAKEFTCFDPHSPFYKMRKIVWLCFAAKHLDLSHFTAKCGVKNREICGKMQLHR